MRSIEQPTNRAKEGYNNSKYVEVIIWQKHQVGGPAFWMDPDSCWKIHINTRFMPIDLSSTEEPGTTKHTKILQIILKTTDRKISFLKYNFWKMLFWKSCYPAQRKEATLPSKQILFASSNEGVPATMNGKHIAKIMTNSMPNSTTTRPAFVNLCPTPCTPLNLFETKQKLIITYYLNWNLKNVSIIVYVFEWFIKYAFTFSKRIIKL